MGNLTVKQIENAKPREKPFKLIDGDGLQLRIASDGIKSWLVRYMFDGKERQYRLPELYGDGEGRIGLKQAREESTLIRSLARKGIDIQVKLDNERKAVLDLQLAEVAKSKTLEDLFEEWVKTVDRKDEGKEIRRSFVRDVFPITGQLKLSDVQPEHIEKILRNVVARGSNRIAVTLFADIKQMFRWAGRRRTWKAIFDNPTDEVELKRILPKAYDGAERTRTLNEDEIRELSGKLATCNLIPRIQAAVWLMLASCTRIGEVIQARWEHVDLDTGVWTIPKEIAKNRKMHFVFLSPFALKQFQKLKRLSTNETWCFPNKKQTTHVCLKSATKQIRDRQLSALGRDPMTNRTKHSDALLLSNGDWVPHDLRRTGSTMMQALGVNPAVIERVLNHTEPSKIIRTYQTFNYAEDQREAWLRLGKRLSEIVPQHG